MRTWWAPRVRSLVGVLFLLVLALPFLLMGVQRLLENALILETEHALMVEAVVVGEVYRQRLDPRAALAPLSAPVRDEDRYAPLVPQLDLSSSPILPPATRQGPAGTSSVSEDHLTPLLERALVRNLSGVRVLDMNGDVIASPLHSQGYSLAHLPEVAAALEGRYAPVLRRRFSDEPAPPLASMSRAAELRVSLAWPVYRDPRAKLGSGQEVIGVIYSSRTPLDTTRALWAWREKLYPPFLLSVLLTLGAVVFLSLTLSRPLSRLRRHAEQVAEGASSGGYRVGRVAPQEVHVLAEALDKMSQQLSARADYIREFAANAAHELKTPLTSLRGAAELLIETDDTIDPARRRRFLQNIQDDAVRMDQLVQRILELARIESTRPQKQALDLSNYLQGLAERYRRQGHIVELSVPQQCTVHVVLEQMESLCVNLLDNAVRHGVGEPVQVELRCGPEVLLSVTNGGPELDPGHLDRVFERFYSTTREQGGTGLGLAIVHAVALAHGGQVQARVEAQGATFEVRLPASALTRPA